MGKRIVSQHRGHGGPRYTAPSFRYLGRVTHRNYDSVEKNEVMKGVVVDLVNSVGHSSPLAMVEFDNGERIYAIANEGLYVGQEVTSGNNSEAKKGNTMPLKNIPEGTQIFNIEKSPGDLGKFVKSAGGSARIDTKTKNKVIVRMPSKGIKQFHPECRATIGVIAGAGKVDKPILKAGKKHFMMKAKNKLYPKTSAGAMNATDHPFGSGRGGPTFGGKSSSIAPKHAPPGRRVGMLRAKKSGGGNK